MANQQAHAEIFTDNNFLSRMTNSEADRLAQKFGALSRNTDPSYAQDQFADCELDAYRHALFSAWVARNLYEGPTHSDTRFPDSIDGIMRGKALSDAKLLGDLNETRSDYRTDKRGTDHWINARNMDLHNNDVGRRGYFEWLDARSTGQTNASLEEWIYRKVQNGETINNLEASRLRPIDPSLIPGAIEEIFGGLARIQMEFFRLGLNALKNPKDKLFDYFRYFFDFDKVFNPFKDAFRNAELWQRRDPIILDLDGDGVETLAQASGRHFDHDGNGFAEQTGWVGADDGLLIRDRQPGAAITSGSQLFGDFTLLSNGTTAAHGFEALADLDDNHDGVIDQADAAWAELAIWKDSNSDAYLDPGERLSLEQAGVRQLRLFYRHGDQVDGQGNQHLQLGTYLTSQGEERAMEDIGFSVDLARTQELEWLALDPDIEALPNLAGLGNVHSLHQAMQRDPSGALKSIVLQWTQASEEERAQLIRPLIFRWTGVFEQSASPLPGLSDGRMLAALEAFFGQRYRNGAGIQGEIPGQQLEKVFNDFAEVTSALLESNKLLSPIIQRLDFTWDDVSENFVINVEQAAQYLVETQAADPSSVHLKR